MKTLWCLVCCGLLAVSLSVPGETAADEVTTIEIVTQEWDMLTNADGTGLWFDIVRAVYEPAGVALNITFLPWKRSLDMVNNQEADAYFGEYDEDIYTEHVWLPRYPLDSEIVAAIFPQGTFPDWNDKTSLQGTRVICPRGADYHLTELAGIDITYYEVDDIANGLKMLEAGRADAYADNLESIKYALEESGLDAAAYRIEPLWSVYVYVAFAQTPKSKRLIEIYDERIPLLRDSGELQQIFERWEVEFPAFEPREE